MSALLKFIVVFIVLAGLTCSVQAQTIKLEINHETGIYKGGEKIKVIAILPNHTNDTLHVKVWKNNDQLLLKTDVIPTKDTCEKIGRAHV